MKKIIAILLVAASLTASIFAASKKSAKIGVSMPTKDLQRWNQDGSNMKNQLKKAGYRVDLQFANNDIATQVSQIENMITGNCEVLVVASIDGSALKNALDAAKKKGIKVIAYDRLIMNSDAVSYYATFDNYKVGTLQGDFLVEKLNLKNRTSKDPAYIELFTGSPDDNNINFFFGGAMDVLTPYINSKVLVVRSGQTSKAQCATLNWSTEEAQKRMENLITSNGYGPKGKKLDAVYSSNDSCAMGITNALVAAGYTADNFPIVTGQDCDIVSVKNMIKGTQAMSIFKDTRTLATKVVEMVDALVKGTNPPINDTKTYDNGTGIIPSYLCDPVFATIDNYKELLIKSGYYKETQLK
ncbi:MAG: sugar ABC transporter substrate-binding protein [Treponema sp.]|jgi:putative multiple sugar transport system substrate-binding protein|nr:sugar ABC transporter substrate-binding protein [Treponema sp.]